MPELEVLGGGFGRTGTLSLCLALNQLGYRTHHMKEVLGAPDQPAAWLRAVRDRAAGRPVDWDGALGGYTAAVDWPSVGFLRELLAANPRAKVVLTTRDFDSWYESASNTIFRVHEVIRGMRVPFFLAPLFRGLTNTSDMADELIWQGAFGGRFSDKEAARQVYEAHLCEVRRLVPPDQLLEFSVGEGWGPLCAFLGKPVPESPFPRANDTAEFGKALGGITKLARNMRLLAAAGDVAIAAGVAAAAVLLAVKLLRRS